ncbi:MAG: bifunctional nuclease family protein [Flavobacteriales bacterium]|jgi:bifunctional DNase/RNase|tara:strand:+ start:240 stop:833 length:594 start_codon:yes stop_codon:yes gene_type:complete
MDKIELEISDIAPSGSTSGAYALVLKQIDGHKKLPIVIGGHEAQAIAIELEKMTPSRPLTHDLFKSFSTAFTIDIEEIIIYNLIEGIFFAKIIAVQDGRKAEIDARTSDAVAVAVRFECPIYCYDFILDSAGIDAEGEDGAFNEDDLVASETKMVEESTEALSVVELEAQLNQALEDEDYEKATILRDEINKRTGES